uniref:INCENP_ARK-bind domain-containing protein n=1 Tax=Rhabditophanes sp. KR3021 TaxID=114890 RepID=A0AC35UGB1_9BILA
MPPKSKRLMKSPSNVPQKDRNVKNPFLHLFDENPDQFLPSGSICLDQFMPDEKELDEINLKINDVYGAVVVPKLMGIAKEFLESREQFKEKRGKDIKFRTTPVRGNASSKIRSFIDELNLRIRSPIEECAQSEDRDVEMGDVTLADSENRKSCKAESPTPTYSPENETITLNNRDTGPLATSTPFIFQGNRLIKGVRRRFESTKLCEDKNELSLEKVKNEGNTTPIVTKRKSNQMIPSSPTSCKSPAAKAVRVGNCEGFSKMIPKKSFPSPVIVKDVGENRLTLDDKNCLTLDDESCLNLGHESAPMVSSSVNVSNCNTPKARIISNRPRNVIVSEFDIANSNVDDESDDADASKKEVPQWAQIKNLQKIMEKQRHRDVESIFGTMKPLILSDVFKDYINKESGN